MNTSLESDAPQRSWYLPDGIYNALPYLYMAVGILTIAWLGNGMAIFSGLTLIAAGGTVWLLRYQYRRDARQGAPASGDGGRSALLDATDGGLVRISWRSAYECGHPVIDEQHRQLFDLSNELINAVLEWKPKSHVEAMFNQLVDHITDHFCTEESILARSRNALTAEHQQIHRALLAKAVSLRDRYRQDDIEVGELVGFLVYDVVTQHIIRDDSKFARAAAT